MIILPHNEGLISDNALALTLSEGHINPLRTARYILAELDIAFKEISV